MMSPSALDVLVQITDQFQEFMKMVSADGILKSWGLEVCLQNVYFDIQESRYSSQLLIGLHSLQLLTSRLLEGLGHDFKGTASDVTDNCWCGWETSMLSECGHTELSRYTPNTVIQWTEGECHVILATDSIEEDCEPDDSHHIEKTATHEDQENASCSESLTSDLPTTTLDEKANEASNELELTIKNSDKISIDDRSTVNEYSNESSTKIKDVSSLTQVRKEDDSTPTEKCATDIEDRDEFFNKLLVLQDDQFENYASNSTESKNSSEVSTKTSISNNNITNTGKKEVSGSQQDSASLCVSKDSGTQKTDSIPLFSEASAFLSKQSKESHDFTCRTATRLIDLLSLPSSSSCESNGVEKSLQNTLISNIPQISPPVQYTSVMPKPQVSDSLSSLFTPESYAKEISSVSNEMPSTSTLQSFDKVNSLGNISNSSNDRNISESCIVSNLSSNPSSVNSVSVSSQDSHLLNNCQSFSPVHTIMNSTSQSVITNNTFSNVVAAPPSSLGSATSASSTTAVPSPAHYIPVITSPVSHIHSPANCSHTMYSPINMVPSPAHYISSSVPFVNAVPSPVNCISKPCPSPGSCIPSPAHFLPKPCPSPGNSAPSPAHFLPKPCTSPAYFVPSPVLPNPLLSPINSILASVPPNSLHNPVSSQVSTMFNPLHTSFTCAPSPAHSNPLPSTFNFVPSPAHSNPIPSPVNPIPSPVHCNPIPCPSPVPSPAHCNPVMSQSINPLPSPAHCNHVACPSSINPVPSPAHCNPVPSPINLGSFSNHINNTFPNSVSGSCLVSLPSSLNLSSYSVGLSSDLDFANTATNAALSLRAEMTSLCSVINLSPNNSFMTSSSVASTNSNTLFNSSTQGQHLLPQRTLPGVDSSGSIATVLNFAPKANTSHHNSTANASSTFDTEPTCSAGNSDAINRASSLQSPNKNEDNCSSTITNENNCEVPVSNESELSFSESSLVNRNNTDGNGSERTTTKRGSEAAACNSHKDNNGPFSKILKGSAPENKNLEFSANKPSVVGDFNDKDLNDTDAMIGDHKNCSNATRTFTELTTKIEENSVDYVTEKSCSDQPDSDSSSDDKVIEKESNKSVCGNKSKVLDAKMSSDESDENNSDDNADDEENRDDDEDDTSSVSSSSTSSSSSSSSSDDDDRISFKERVEQAAQRQAAALAAAEQLELARNTATSNWIDSNKDKVTTLQTDERSGQNTPQQQLEDDIQHSDYSGQSSEEYEDEFDEEHTVDGSEFVASTVPTGNESHRTFMRPSMVDSYPIETLPDLLDAADNLDMPTMECQGLQSLPLSSEKCSISDLIGLNEPTNLLGANSSGNNGCGSIGPYCQKALINPNIQQAINESLSTDSSNVAACTLPNGVRSLGDSYKTNLTHHLTHEDLQISSLNTIDLSSLGPVSSGESSGYMPVRHSSVVCGDALSLAMEQTLGNIMNPSATRNDAESQIIVPPQQVMPAIACQRAPMPPNNNIQQQAPVQRTATSLPISASPLQQHQRLPNVMLASALTGQQQHQMLEAVTSLHQQPAMPPPPQPACRLNQSLNGNTGGSAVFIGTNNSNNGIRSGVSQPQAHVGGVGISNQRSFAGVECMAARQQSQVHHINNSAMVVQGGSNRMMTPQRYNNTMPIKRDVQQYITTGLHQQQQQPLPSTSFINNTTNKSNSEPMNISISLPSVQMQNTTAAKQNQATVTQKQALIDQSVGNRNMTQNVIGLNEVQSKAPHQIQNTSETIINNSDGKPEKSFSCNLCSKVFKRRISLLNHTISHTGEKLTCKTCKAGFTTAFALKRHSKAHHQKTTEYRCSTCNKCFSSHGNLKFHEKGHDKPFECNVCGRRFALKVTRDTHARSHEGVRPFACTECNKTFLAKNKLNAHMKGHKGELVCKECNTSFRSQDMLARHRRVHHNEAIKDSVCPVCNKKFGLPSKMRDHYKKIHGKTTNSKE